MRNTWVGDGSVTRETAPPKSKFKQVIDSCLNQQLGDCAIFGSVLVSFCPQCGVDLARKCNVSLSWRADEELATE